MRCTPRNAKKDGAAAAVTGSFLAPVHFLIAHNCMPLATLSSTSDWGNSAARCGLQHAEDASAAALMGVSVCALAAVCNVAAVCAVLRDVSLSIPRGNAAASMGLCAC